MRFGKSAFPTIAARAVAWTGVESPHKALELLRDGLKPFIERELQARLGNDWNTRVSAVHETA